MDDLEIMWDDDPPERNVYGVLSANMSNFNDIIEKFPTDPAYIGAIIGRDGSNIKSIKTNASSRNDNIQVATPKSGENGENRLSLPTKNVCIGGTEKKEVLQPIDWESLNRKVEEYRKLQWAHLPKLRKNFYQEVKEIAVMTEEEVNEMRLVNNNIIVSRLKTSEDQMCLDIPKPIYKFDHCFKDYPDILDELKKQNFTEPSPIQKQAWPILLRAVQHERGPRKPKLHPQLHHHHPHHPHHHHHTNGLPPHHPHHHPGHLPVSLVTNVSASFNYTSHISTHPTQGFHAPPTHPTAFHHPGHALAQHNSLQNGGAGVGVGLATGTHPPLPFPPHLLPQMHHNLIAEAASKLPSIPAQASASTAAAIVGAVNAVAAATLPPSSLSTVTSTATSTGTLPVGVNNVLPTYDLTNSGGSSGSTGAGSATSLDFYAKSTMTQNYSSPSPSNSIQSISSIGVRSSIGSESPRVNVETETPSATPPLSTTASPAPSPTDTNITSPGSPMSISQHNSTTPTHQPTTPTSSTHSPNNQHQTNLSAPMLTSSAANISGQAAAAGALYAARQNGFLELLLSPDKCQEIIQYQVHNSILFPPLPQQLIGMDSRLLSWEMLQETTARLLFMAVRWVKCLMPFQTLSKNDQYLLLQESWKELFLLNLAQWTIPLDLTPILETPIIKERVLQDEATQTEMKTIQEILCRFRQITPDGSEVGCMKAIALFAPETPGLCDVQPVEMLQDQAQCILSDHVRLRYPRQATRFGRLLLLLPSLRTIRASTIEALFFKETIGNVPIARLLRDMYSMEPAQVEK
ncbi:uncharacterized protein LOC119688615 [Teleopsis dalmanni]|uniref:uncharacterized protein LOC119688615 n=1 Tax=Teleopsis dalmanni TaxID=139649 RepID=UPI0018CF7D18|nr:uncharacterized protein LOC119688615 [Teleopsis dalmanni]